MILVCTIESRPKVINFIFIKVTFFTFHPLDFLKRAHSPLEIQLVMDTTRHLLLRFFSLSFVFSLYCRRVDFLLKRVSFEFSIASNLKGLSFVMKILSISLIFHYGSSIYNSIQLKTDLGQFDSAETPVQMKTAKFAFVQIAPFPTSLYVLPWNSLIYNFPDIMTTEPVPFVVKNQQTKVFWNNFAPVYSTMDSTMQTFFYTLANMLELRSASHILEIACGTGRLIPYAVSLKRPQCTYLASDLCENMIQLSQKHIAQYLAKMGSTNPESWIEKNSLSFRVVDGQKPIETPHKFDRIICNLVLMITEDPKKMLENLASVASEGCLLGVTVWGDKKLSNFMTLTTQAMKHLGLPVPSIRENFHLYNNLEPLAQSSGWEIVVQWEQNAPFSFLNVSEDVKAFIKGAARGNQQIAQYMQGKILETFKQKKVLNFPVQMAILKRK